MKLKLDNRGVSLSITIGLLLLLVIMTTAVNQLVIRALRASHDVEASEKAYFAAEGGIEDALYELSSRVAGYETPDLLSSAAREDQLDDSTRWINQWEIKNRNLNPCDGSLDQWNDPTFSPNYCGELFEGQKLVINLFTDEFSSGGLPVNQVDTTDKTINKIYLNSWKMTIRIPDQVVATNSSVFSGVQPLQIDNDGDYNAGSGTGLNEDGHPNFGFTPNTCPYTGGVSINDNDCDGREDEDSPQDPVILWRLADPDGYSFQPLRGCKTDPQHASHPNPGESNSTLCEKDFVLDGGELSATLTEADMGINQDDIIMDLAAFIDSVPDDHQLQMEFLIVSPMEVVDVANAKKIPIPYLEYGIQYDSGGSVLPATSFLIKSDGYFNRFKQSITTRVIPRVTTKLLDLTILQQ